MSRQPKPVSKPDLSWDYENEPARGGREAAPLRDEPTANVTPPAQAQQTPQKAPLDDEIRKLAYGLWEQAGRPTGDGKEFWEAAEQQLNTQMGTYAGQTEVTPTK